MQTLELCENNLIFFKNGVSGVPYLNNPPWIFCKIYTIMEHLGALVKCNGQNSLEPKWPLKWAVQSFVETRRTEMVPRLRESAPTARGSQDARSRNLRPTLLATLSSLMYKKFRTLSVAHICQNNHKCFLLVPFWQREVLQKATWTFPR